MPTVSESVCCQEIPETEGKLRELDVQNTVSLIMRGSDQFAWKDGWCKQSPCTCISSIAKAVEPMDLHTILLSSPHSHVDVWISFKSVVYHTWTLCYMAHRQLARWCWKYLERIQVVLSSCAVK